MRQQIHHCAWRDRLGFAPITLLASFLAAPNHTSGQAALSEWERVDVPPPTTFLADVWVYGSPDTYTGAVAVGYDSATQSGVIYQFDGTSWIANETLTLSNLYLNSVWGVSLTDAFAVGENVILRYNGSMWVKMPVYGTYELRAVWASSTNDAFAVGQSGLILHYAGPKADPWTEWELMNSGDGPNPQRCLGIRAEQHLGGWDQQSDHPL